MIKNPNGAKVRTSYKSDVFAYMWLIFAVSASIIWAVDYTFGERILRHISASTLLLFQGLLLLIVSIPIALYNSGFKKDMLTIMSSQKMMIYFLIPVCFMVIGNYLVVNSIQAKNATLVGLVEISYPLMIVLFSWWYFKENQLTTSAAIGGSLIFIGVFIIYFFNK